MINQEEIIIAGYGGQGTLLAGTVLAQAGLESGKNVTSFPSYGAEMRGGIANCTTVISDDEIGSPVVSKPATLIILNNLSLRKFLPRLQENGLLITNSSLVTDRIERKDIKLVNVPATGIAEKEIGNVKTANMVMLGAYLKHQPIIPLESLLKAIEILFANKKELISLNQRAAKLGYDYATKNR